MMMKQLDAGKHELLHLRVIKLRCFDVVSFWLASVMRIF